jgi:hypothetical protein
MNVNSILFYSGAALAGVTFADAAANVIKGGTVGGNGPVWGYIFSNPTFINYYFPEYVVLVVGLIFMILGILL